MLLLAKSTKTRNCLFISRLLWAQIQAQRHGGPGGEAEGELGLAVAPHRHGRCLLDGRHSRASARHHRPRQEVRRPHLR